MRESEKSEGETETDRQTDRDRELLSQDSCSGYQGRRKSKKKQKTAAQPLRQ